MNDPLEDNSQLPLPPKEVLSTPIAMLTRPYPEYTSNVRYEIKRLYPLHFPVAWWLHRSSDQLPGVWWDQADG
jgi:hypothetical protein